MRQRKAGNIARRINTVCQAHAGINGQAAIGLARDTPDVIRGGFDAHGHQDNIGRQRGAVLQNDRADAVIALQ